ncbi:IS5 family transposase [Streptomyces sp. NPDC101132]|uniref:IS5 family transposase n=1 Tax=Streptomyces sp. NPDC101132 TaxID=3366110 RepID=UPI003828C558
MGRRDLTDEQWAVLEPLLPKGTKTGRPPVWPRRQFIDGIRFRVRTGVPWRDVPAEYGPWGWVYDLFRRWQRNGTWHRILTRLQSLADAKGTIVWDLNVGSTVCRAHQHAAGARKQGDLQKEPPGGIFVESGDHALGRSRGGFTTKLHLAVEQGQKPMSIVLTAGQRGDSPQFEPVLGEGPRAPHRAGPPARPPQPSPGGQGVRLPQDCAYLRRRGIRCTIPTRPTRPATARSSAPVAAGRHVLTRSTTASAMRSSAGSTASRDTVPSPPGTTSSPSATR